jgi:choline-glycine betaine transporter
MAQSGGLLGLSRIPFTREGELHMRLTEYLLITLLALIFAFFVYSGFQKGINQLGEKTAETIRKAGR